jgi:hypothetical protein
MQMRRTIVGCSLREQIPLAEREGYKVGLNRFGAAFAGADADAVV